MCVWGQIVFWSPIKHVGVEHGESWRGEGVRSGKSLWSSEQQHMARDISHLYIHISHWFKTRGQLYVDIIIYILFCKKSGWWENLSTISNEMCVASTCRLTHRITMVDALWFMQHFPSILHTVLCQYFCQRLSTRLCVVYCLLFICATAFLQYWNTTPRMCNKRMQLLKHTPWVAW
jgi:hypothetical protein